MPTGSITVDEKFAPELVEYWAHKYQETKGALDQVQRSTQLEVDKNELALEHYSKLKDLIASLQTESNKRQGLEDDLRQELAIAEKDKKELVKQISKVEIEKSALIQQLDTIFSQATAIATEADLSRRDKVKTMFPPVSFVEPSFMPAALSFFDPQTIINTLPSQFPKLNKIYFLPRPPCCMPLRVPACGQPGYWFYPSWSLPGDTQFQLVVEGRAGEWSYLGCYISAAMPGAEMKLSEWMTLDEQTKIIHCSRVANQALQPGQTPSMPALLGIKNRYDLGEWSVPCFSLQCVGFDMALYQALHSAAISVRLTHNPAPAGGSISGTSNTVSRKRSRTKTQMPDDGDIGEVDSNENHKKAREILKEKHIPQASQHSGSDKENAS